MVTAVPPAAGPEIGSIENTMRGVSSDVFPPGSVAVPTTTDPAAIVPATVTSKLIAPVPSVTTSAAPR